MASSLDGQPSSNSSSSSHQRILSQFRGDWVSRFNVDQMFMLVDGILPFEACLYYQVLPLFLEGNRLHLGMVSPDDTSASEYVRRIISYLNYSLVSHAISSEALRVSLTAYLNYVGTQQAEGKWHESVSYGHYRHSARVKAEQYQDPNERLTLVVDSPDDLYTSEENQTESLSGPKSSPPIKQEQPMLPEVRPQITPEFTTEFATEFVVAEEGQTEIIEEDLVDSLQTRPPLITDVTLTERASEPLVEVPPPVRNTPVEAFTESPLANSADNLSVQSSSQSDRSPAHPLAVLHVEANYLTSSVESLASLPAPQLVQELLARVLLGGIGRLYFERYPQHGRVVWSQNGILQSVLDRVSLSTFQGIVHELKTMACVSLLPTEQPQQAEMEYLYDRNCILLRFRFMPGLHGEEATVQVLRGAALRFHQRQQLGKLKRDAQTIAQQLQNKLNEIRVRAYSSPKLLEAKLDKLPRLNELLQSIQQQLDEIEIDQPE